MDSQTLLFQKKACAKLKNIHQRICCKCSAPNHNKDIRYRLVLKDKSQYNWLIFCYTNVLSNSVDRARNSFL